MLARALLAAAATAGVTAGGPGNYVHYTWPALPAGSFATSIEMKHFWGRLPHADEVNGNAVFSSTQHWFGPSGVGAYMGTQAWRQDNGTMTYRALFSCWDASTTVQTSWLDGPGYCERFGGEGTGSHCIIPITLLEKTLYSLKLQYVGHVANASGAMGAAWRGSITNLATNESSVIGTLFHPDFNGGVGYGNLTITSADFQEYFLASDCPNQAVSGAGLIGPQFTLTDGSTVLPVTASADYVSDCVYSNVVGCIPGIGCGAPNAYMEAGGYTNRTTPAGGQLW